MITDQTPPLDRAHFALHCAIADFVIAIQNAETSATFEDLDQRLTEVRATFESLARSLREKQTATLIAHPNDLHRAERLADRRQTWTP